MKIKTILVGSIIILAIFMSGCVEQQNEQQDNVDTKVGDGTLQLKITDKPGDLNIIHANVTISTIQVHKADADNDEEEDENDDEEIENIDEYDDGFITVADGPYFGDIGEDITFEGNATEGLDEPYNWTWDFGDGDISYEKNETHNYSIDGEYIVNLTVTNNSGNGVSDWYITTATIGIIDDDDTSTAGWYTIIEESQEFDLIELQNVTDILGEENLSAGKYTQIRLTVEQAEITINNSGTIEVHDMKIPSNKVKLIKAFWIYENETTELTLDFDVYESVHQTGNNKFIMKPTIKIIQG